MVLLDSAAVFVQSRNGSEIFLMKRSIGRDAGPGNPGRELGLK